MGALEVLLARGISKRFGERLALPPVSFGIAEGEHLAITGRSGSGKTTLVRILAGLLEPTAGEVLEHGKVVSRPGFREPPHLRGIGMLFQGLALWPHLTIREQVALSARTGSRRERRRRVEMLLDGEGLLPLADRYPAELSGGERQRAAWARAVAGEPRLLFLDEPLTSLDPALRDDLLAHVAAFGQLPGRTIVVITHDPSVAARLGRRVLALGGEGGAAPPPV